jgi:hypothetical protein
MAYIDNMTEIRRTAFVVLLAMFLAVCSALAERAPNFSGTWKLSGEQCEPKRTGDVTLLIDHHNPVLTITTRSRKASSGMHEAIQRYSTDGKVSVSTGIDGDEFHTSIVSNNDGLVFNVEEHEDGRIIISRESWTLTDGGATIRRVRDRPASNEKQIFIYLRQPDSTGRH